MITNKSTPMCNKRPAGGAVEALEANGTTTGADNLTWREQHNAINPYAKQTFFRTREWRTGPVCKSIECKWSETK